MSEKNSKVKRFNYLKTLFLYMISLLLFFGLLFSITACGKVKERIYCELGIILPREFKKTDTKASFDVAYSNEQIIIGVTRLSFEACLQDSIPTTMTPLKFAKYYMETTKKEDVATDIKEDGDTVYYSYKMKVNNGEYFYMPTFYRTPYAYFVIMYICPSIISESAKDEMLSYAKTVFIKD